MLKKRALTGSMIEQTLRKNKYNNKDAEHITNFFKEANIQNQTPVNVCNISCVNEKETFNIVVDGVEYGPFTRICVSPLKISSPNNSKLKVKTCFPVTVNY